VDFGELNDKTITGLMYLSKFVSRFYFDIHEQLLEYLFLDEYYMAHIGEDKYVIDPYANWLMSSNECIYILEIFHEDELHVSKECGSLTKNKKGSYKEKLVILSSQVQGFM
jgi:hypothetical protein